MLFALAPTFERSAANRDARRTTPLLVQPRCTSFKLARLFQLTGEIVLGTVCDLHKHLQLLSRS